MKRFSNLILACGILIPCLLPTAMAGDARPNILWLSTEDISAHFGCYGDTKAITPNIDKLASEGMRFTHAFTTAGVCAPSRSGIITGLYQTTLGTQHMRCTATLPEEIKPFPFYLRKAGYFCTNNEKEDYQFKTPAGTWDDSSKKAHWRERKDKTQPFFAVFNYLGTHEGWIANTEKYKEATQVLTPAERQDPKQLTQPPYFSDTPAVREAWKRNYELITAMGSLVLSNGPQRPQHGRTGFPRQPLPFGSPAPTPCRHHRR
jgi:uncharacterized sulfatase